MPKTDPEKGRNALRLLLRELRKKAGIRQKELAQRLGRPQSYVSKYEIGERKLDLIEILEVCQVVGISLEEFTRKFSTVIKHERE